MKGARKSLPALSVLIVEDDEPTLKLIGLLVGKKFPDLKIRATCNGKLGVRLCREHLPDLVITDINMAEMDGIQMAGQIKSISKETRFIVLTGYSDKGYLDKFKEIGVSDYIVKPINFKKLCAAIQKCIDEIGCSGSDQAAPMTD